MKEIPVHIASDEENNENLKLEEWETPYKKEIFKSLWIILGIFILIYAFVVFAIETPKIDEQRQEQIRKANELKSETIKLRNKYMKVVSIYETNLEELDNCIKANSNTWTVSECKILLNK